MKKMKEDVKVAIKKILGLEECPLQDWEIMEKIAEAQRNNVELVEFCYGKLNVKVKLNRIRSDGMMRGNRGYYSE
ncbi:hypothetical protein COY27_05835 [Candidatus Woesearchaeota archaeon CG_4_10_14_0_2_um_filter_33_13]|nr:MAG: hypothetical protein COY27_05835 [Candidatus Woesearchaeota archaeon CG_4_10_14_0_2_um_filter_33_13]